MKVRVALILALVLAVLLVTPLAAKAQPAGKVVRVGILAAGGGSTRVEAFRQGLRELGYVEGKNLAIEIRFGPEDRLSVLAVELTRLGLDVIVTDSTPATTAAKRATTTIPIVFAAAGDPIGSGFVASLARPGGNVTGLTEIIPELSGKRLEILKEAVPGWPSSEIPPTPSIRACCEPWRLRPQG